MSSPQPHTRPVEDDDGLQATDDALRVAHGTVTVDVVPTDHGTGVLGYVQQATTQDVETISLPPAAVALAATHPGAKLVPIWNTPAWTRVPTDTAAGSC